MWRPFCIGDLLAFLTELLPAEAGRLEGDRDLRTEVLRSRFGNSKIVPTTVGLRALLLADAFLNHPGIHTKWYFRSQWLGELVWYFSTPKF
jgi:hypothetical protein